MFRNTKSLALVGAVVATGSLFPGNPAAAATVCQAKSLGVHSELGQIVQVTGVYRGPADAVDVQLTCGVVQSGVTVARVTDKVPGPVAALADVVSVPNGAISSCYEVRIRHVGGATTYYDACP